LGEFELSRNVQRTLTLALVAAAISLIVIPMLVSSQSEGIALSTTLQDLQRAQAAGATQTEMQRLVDELNSIVNLQTELQSMSPSDMRRDQLLSEINSTLTTVDAQAVQLESVAAQRTYLNHVYAYSLGVIGAIVGTVVYYYGLILYRRYRIKQTFRMKITPK